MLEVVQPTGSSTGNVGVWFVLLCSLSNIGPLNPLIAIQSLSVLPYVSDTIPIKLPLP